MDGVPAGGYTSTRAETVPEVLVREDDATTISTLAEEYKFETYRNAITGDFYRR